ncbi:kinase-like domain-containing protein [Amylostereum chailletii]|nr:kinase-like domain-containing protein [Amylostereum chailletii]
MAKAQNEAAALRLVASTTTIPVPRYFGCFSWRGLGYVVMSRAQGVELNKVWLQLSDGEKDVIVGQLARYTAQLRTLQSPYGSRICSAIGTPVYDGRLGSDVQREIISDDWIFDDEDAMNAALRGYTSLDELPADVQRSHATRHPIHFTHADLQPRNIMVDPRRLRVTAVFDWAYSGWYPAHWEYRKATWPVVDAETRDWLAYAHKVTPAYEMEIKADDYLADIFWRV